ncbi:collagen-like triple helix repeat-containing protein [Lysinibacillus fusiformis]|uniref:collagen-like triple helix repeat-containing protein n=1 Tax=Lysinibacillus fusiformis TaxID=28031 RepID=UPI0004683A29|nr:collagen-like protein [Lysinibacillus fusiformis]
MARMRVIGASLDKGYRDDLNYNFGLLEALIGEANGLTDNLREEMLEKIYNLQQQIDMLTGENIGELLERLTDSIQQALTAAQDARTAKTAAEEATALATTATELANASALLAEEKANYANDKAVLAQEAADNANQEASSLSQLKVNVVQATQDANTATANANQATQDATTATNAINLVLPNVTGLVNMQEWSNTITYKKNNFVTLEGNGYMALRDNTNTRPPSFPVLSNDDWAMLVQKGEKGEQGTGVRILGTLPNESALPPVGEPGDAYMVGEQGNLYVWQDNEEIWQNVGQIKGPKGDQGIQGPKGDKGDKGDPGEDVEIIDNLVTQDPTKALSARAGYEIDQKTTGHINNKDVHLQAGDRTKIDNALQRGTENTDVLTNISPYYAKRVFNMHQAMWNSSVNVEQLDVTIPILGSFSGIIKVKYTSYWTTSEAIGGCEVTYQIGAYLGHPQARLNTYEITSMSPKFANDYLVYGAYINLDVGIIALMIKKAAHASNNMTISVEMEGISSLGAKTSYQALRDAYLSAYDSGSPTGNGISPWVPQTSSFAKSALPTWQNTVLGAGWENVAGYPPLRFYKDGFGIVHLKGRVKNVTQTTPEITTLPVGYAIKQTEEFIGMAGASNVANFEVRHDGKVAALSTNQGQNILIDCSYRTD